MHHTSKGNDAFISDVNKQPLIITCIYIASSVILQILNSSIENPTSVDGDGEKKSLHRFHNIHIYMVLSCRAKITWCGKLFFVTWYCTIDIVSNSVSFNISISHFHTSVVLQIPCRPQFNETRKLSRQLRLFYTAISLLQSTRALPVVTISFSVYIMRQFQFQDTNSSQIFCFVHIKRSEEMLSDVRTIQQLVYEPKSWYKRWPQKPNV